MDHFQTMCKPKNHKSNIKDDHLESSAVHFRLKVSNQKGLKKDYYSSHFFGLRAPSPSFIYASDFHAESPDWVVFSEAPYEHVFSVYYSWLWFV